MRSFLNSSTSSLRRSVSRIYSYLHSRNRRKYMLATYKIKTKQLAPLFALAETHDMVTPFFSLDTLAVGLHLFFIAIFIPRFSSVTSFCRSTLLHYFSNVFFISGGCSSITSVKQVYQSFDKVDMCIRTVFELSVSTPLDYIGLCSLVKQVIYTNFLLYYRPYLYDLFCRTLLRVPNKVGSSVLYKLPIQHKELLRKIAYSSSKLSRYKKYLVKHGILKIPTFSFLDGIFSSYSRSNLNTISNTFSQIKRTSCDTVTHGFSYYQSNFRYIHLYYFFLFSYIFSRSKKKATWTVFSRVLLFSMKSTLLYNRELVHTSTTFMYSYLDRISSLYVNSIVPSNTELNINRDYVKIYPFFHSGSLVFLHSIKSRVVRAKIAYHANTIRIINYVHFFTVLFRYSSIRDTL